LKRQILQPLEIDLGEKAALLPDPEPEVGIAPPFGRRIPVCEPTLRGRELEYVRHCVETNWISSIGSYIPRFEQQFAAAVGARYGVACTSGTTALHLILHTLGLGPGDEVIVPTFTMIATANAVRYTGARPVLVDSERRTWNIDPARIEEKITENTVALLPMHTYGHPCDMDPILELAQRYDLWVIEDAAEAHGAAYRGRPVGSLGDAACFSFYANKILTTGEGGMITTDHEELARRARNVRDHAFSDERHFWHKCLGMNYRMTNLQAAVGVAQVEQFEALVQARIDHARLYHEGLRGLPGLTLPPETEGVQNVYWMYGLLVEEEFGLSRDELRRRLAARGIETRTFFIPIHLQPIYYEQYRHEAYPVAEELSRKGLYLPSSSSLTPEEIEYVVEAIREVREE